MLIVPLLVVLLVIFIRPFQFTRLLLHTLIPIIPVRMLAISANPFLHPPELAKYFEINRARPRERHTHTHTYTHTQREREREKRRRRPGEMRGEIERERERSNSETLIFPSSL